MKLKQTENRNEKNERNLLRKCKKKRKKKTELRIKRKTVDIIGERKENFKNEEKKEWE